MLLMEILNKNPNFVNQFANLRNYLMDKYGRYEIKYEEGYFMNLTNSLLLKYKFVLKSIEDTLKIVNTSDLSVEKLGESVISTQKIKNSMESVKTHNYEGLNVSGTFEKNSNEYGNDMNVVANSNTYNYYNALFDIQDKETLNMWFMFEKEFVRLLITLIDFSKIPLDF